MYWKCRDRIYDLTERPLVMGILNVTPDSFSDGGRFTAEEQAVEHAMEMLENGADIIDVGGESTRPGAPEVDSETELGRVIPVIEKLAAGTDAVVSIDTTKAVVAEKAVRAGARIINDVSAFTIDPDMSGVAREYGTGIVLMHMAGTPRTMQQNPVYEHVVDQVGEYLERRVEELAAAGVDRETIATDPGIGFGKTVEHNLELLANLKRIATGNRPMLIGLSRKSFLERITGRDVDNRLAGSLAALVYCVLNGATIMRVHDVKESVDAVRTAMALMKHQGTGEESIV